jgi:hypothetical protein
MFVFYAYLVLLLVIMRNLLCAENQILMRDQSGISEEKMKEYKESFDFFDKNKSGQLDKLEFRACLLSTGYATVMPDGLLKAYITKPSVDEALFVILKIVVPAGQRQNPNSQTQQLPSVKFREIGAIRRGTIC